MPPDGLIAWESQGDVAPPGGDNQVGPDDWVKEGRFVAGLDTPKPGDDQVYGFDGLR